MRTYLAILRRHPVVRASAAAIFFYGVAGAATSPYQAVLGIRELGLSNRAYAAVALAAAVSNVILSIAFGMISDRFRNYRRPLIFVSAFGIIGYGAIWAVPSPAVFALATVGPLALFHATNSMLFANVRAHSDRLAPEETAIVNSLMRMMISLAWVLVPGAVGLALRGQATMIGAWAIAAALAGCVLAIIALWLGPDQHSPPPEPVPAGGTGTARVAPTAGRPDRPAQVRAAHPFPGLLQLMSPAIGLRILGVALISQVLHVNATVLPLIVTGQAGGRPDDIGAIVGLVAGLEVVFMVFWSHVTRRLHLTRALLVTAALYLCYLGTLALASATWQVYAASVVAGFAAAGIISLPISYLLDLIRDRPGLSASLIAVNMFLGGALGATIFAAGTALGGYGTAALLSGAAGVLGAGLLVALERKFR
ncbi:MAG: MFS transporter [Paracoccaceae bacterium]